MTPAPDEAFVAGVIEKLSKAQRAAVLVMDEEWVYPSGSQPPFNGKTLRNLFYAGVADCECDDAGVLHYWLTDFGLAVREQLLRRESGS